MSKKQNYILEYIKNLEIGSKVSIRILADTLNVSEGTVYKAIKCAEESGLVQTRPRAGTIRIEECKKPNIITIKKLTNLLGLSVIIPYDSDFQITAFIIGEGSLEQFIKHSSRISGNRVCIVGDRPDIINRAIESGMHLLITNNTALTSEMLQKAKAQNICVMTSHHSCCTLIHFIHTLKEEDSSYSPTNEVQNWMHRPEYLYYNDILSDWYRTYLPVFSLNNKFAIVNDDLKICGSLNAESIIHASPEERISDLYDSNANIADFTISESASIDEIAKKMIQNNTELLFAEEDGKLKGYITANDILRYYHFNRTKPESNNAFSLTFAEQNHTQWNYRYSISTDMLSQKEELMSIALNISKENMASLFKDQNWILDSGHFFMDEPLESDSELKINSEIVRLSEKKCLCEVTLSTLGFNKWKYVYYYSVH